MSGWSKRTVHTWGIYTMNRDGTGMRRIVSARSSEHWKDGESIVARENFVSSLSWSPRGDDLAFVVEEESDESAYVSEIDSWVLYMVKARRLAVGAAVQVDVEA